MAEEYSRRSFLGGVLACGTLSAGGIFLLPGGRSPASVELGLVTGVDPTGARDLLIEMWNQANPDTTVRVVASVASGSGDERNSMLSHIDSGKADILNLDVIDIPEFAQRELITAIPLAESLQFLEPARRVSQVPGEPDLYWAAPFNTDVGMLFSRRPDSRETESRPLPELLDVAIPAGSRQLVAQLTPDQATSEAFVVNVLEHVLSRDDTILYDDDKVSDQLERWQQALQPLRDAVARDKVNRSAGEPDSLRAFVRDKARYMRNWPVKYRELQQLGDPDAVAARIQVDPLPVGILGGQSLAVVARSRHPERARRFIEFLTGVPAQKILAAHGLAPTRVEAYGDDDLKVLIPHLAKLRSAVGNARPRPMHANYRAFAKILLKHVGDLLTQGRALSPEFIVATKETLG